MISTIRLWALPIFVSELFTTLHNDLQFVRFKGNVDDVVEGQRDECVGGLFVLDVLDKFIELVPNI